MTVVCSSPTTKRCSGFGGVVPVRKVRSKAGGGGMNIYGPFFFHWTTGTIDAVTIKPLDSPEGADFTVWSFMERGQMITALVFGSHDGMPPDELLKSAQLQLDTEWERSLA